jgi:hypothetical protein
MAGKAAAVASGDALVKDVAALGVHLGLQAREQFRCGRRIWGAERFIDVVLTEPVMRRRLGVECKYQRVSGSAEEKNPAIIQDIAAWPISGIVVFGGEGSRRTSARSSWRPDERSISWTWRPRLFFGLDLSADARAKALPLKPPADPPPGSRSE